MLKRCVTRVRGIRLSLGVLALLLPQLLVAQPAPEFRPHYPIGIEGIKAASVPPPGFYLRTYLLGYYSDDLPNGPSNFNLGAFIAAPRPIWMTGLKILGADYGISMIIPFGYQSIEAGPFNDNEFGIADIAVEPLILAWHFPQFDIGAGYAFWAPSGDYDKANPAKLGKGYWDHMFTLGGTVYADEEKTWSASLLGRVRNSHGARGMERHHPGTGLESRMGLRQDPLWCPRRGYRRLLPASNHQGQRHRLQRQQDWVVGLGPEAAGSSLDRPLHVVPLHLRDRHRIPPAGPYVYADDYKGVLIAASLIADNGGRNLVPRLLG